LQALNDLLIEAAGGHAPANEPIASNFGEVDVAAAFLQSRRATIYGGSSEIQRNVLARRVFNLPRWRRARSGHGAASDIRARAVARQRRQIQRGGGAEGGARFSRAGSELRAGTSAAGGGTRVAWHSRSGFDERPWSGPDRARAGAWTGRARARLRANPAFRGVGFPPGAWA